MALHPEKPPSLPPNQPHGTPTPFPHPHPITTTTIPLTVPVSISVQVHHHTHVLRLALIITACIVGLVTFLCTVSLIMKIFYSRRRNRHRNRTNTAMLFDVNEDASIPDDDADDDDDDGHVMHHIWFIRTVGLQQSFIDSIAVFKYAKDEGVIDGTECSVCLGEFEEGESLRLLPKCGHAFHIPCIDTWLASHTNCPLCRAPVAHEHVVGVGPSDHNNHNPTDENVSHNQETHIHNSDGSEDSGQRSEFQGGVSSNGIQDKVEEETVILRRTVSVDSSSSSVILPHVVLDLNSDTLSSNTHFGIDLRSSSSNVRKVASIGRALQKRPVSMRRSFSHDAKFLFSRHCRSQSSTLPL